MYNSAAVSDGSGALSASGSTGQDLSQQSTTLGRQKGSEGKNNTGSDLASKFAAQFSDQVVSTANSYRSKDLSIQVTSHQMGSGKNTITYYIAEAAAAVWKRDSSLSGSVGAGFGDIGWERLRF